MQYFRIHISEACRSHIGIVLFFLNISIMLVCHATGAMGLFVKQEASSFGNFLVFYNTSSLFKLLLCLSLLFLLFHLIGAKICYDSAFYETRERFHSVLFYWLLAGCALVPLTVAAIIVLTAHQSMVVHGIALGFKHAMKKYKIEAPMREYINRLQIEHQCCGATDVSDWYKVGWVDTVNAAPINRLANSHFMETNGEFLPRWAPFSCCRQDFIGAPCESVALFFGPKQNEDWIKKSHIYSIDYLSEYDKYARIFKTVEKVLKKPPQDVVRRGRMIVQSRRGTFDSFLRDVTGHSDAKGPPPPTDRPPSQADARAETARALFEAQGVRAQSFPEALFSRLGKPPWKGRMAWSYDNITTAESGNLDQLLRLDGRDEDSTLELLRWRSFNQGGCAEPIGRAARLTMEAAAALFIYVLVAQILILLLTRYMQTSIDTAYRWGNPLLSAPGFLFNTSQPPRPDDYEALMQEGDEVLGSLNEDIDEDDFTVLLSPSWASGGESENETPGDSSASSTGISGSSVVSGETTSDVSGETTSGITSETASEVSLTTTEPPLGGADGESGDEGDDGDDGEDDDDSDDGGDGDDGDEGDDIDDVYDGGNGDDVYHGGDGDDVDVVDDGDIDGVGGDGEGNFSGTKAPVSRSRVAPRVSSRMVAVSGSANRASARRLRSAVSRQEQHVDQRRDEEMAEEEEEQQSPGEIATTSKAGQKKSSSSKANERQNKKSSQKKLHPMTSSPSKSSQKSTSPNISSPKKSSPTKAISKKSSPKKESLKKSSPKKTSPKKASSKKESVKKSSPRNSRPKKPSPNKSSPRKSSPNKSSPKKSSPRKFSPRKSSPRKSSPKKSSPKKSSPKKSSPKKSSPKKSSPKKTSPKKSSPKKSSPKKTSPKKSKAKSPGKTKNTSKKKVKGHKTKSKKSPKKRNK